MSDFANATYRTCRVTLALELSVKVCTSTDEAAEALVTDAVVAQYGGGLRMDGERITPDQLANRKHLAMSLGAALEIECVDVLMPTAAEPDLCTVGTLGKHAVVCWGEA